MQLHTSDYVYRCEVPGFEGTGLFIHLKAVSNPEAGAYSTGIRGLSWEMATEKMVDLICSKVVKVEGYETPEGDKITTGRELYDRGAPDVWAWLQEVVFSTIKLSAAEVKNS